MASSRRSKAEGGGAVGTRLSAHEIYENVLVQAKQELARPAPALLWSSIAAGLAIGFSFLAGAYLSGIAGERTRGALAAAGYPLGFIFVVLARNQLFTENTLEPIIPLLRRPTLETLRRVLALWGVVLAGNLAGGCVFALAAARTAMLSGPLQEPLLRIARETTSGEFGAIFYLAIFAGWLIALMAWLVSSTHATGAQIALVWLTTAPISAFGFRHSIAGGVEAFYRAWISDMSWGRAVASFLVPAVLGNIVGGVTLVALLNHGQVALERGGSRSQSG
jgi:formate/nitrite transporter FocA (FNT family)